jgi:hypothetical protein
MIRQSKSLEDAIKAAPPSSCCGFPADGVARYAFDAASSLIGVILSGSIRTIR